MSGIVAILNTGETPVERRLLDRLTAALEFRGPDRTGIWLDGPIALGHTLLATTYEAWQEQQPATLGDGVYVTGDIRLDARAELCDKLNLGRRDLEKTTDIELLLRAYRKWGTSCVDEILGDFSFVLWDASRRELFCARDPFGVKLLYYAQVGRALVFSNTISCLRLHPNVSDRLDDRVIGNFLSYGANWDRELTAFADIATLPPGHTLTWSPERPLEVRPYFELPAESPPVHYSDQRDYVDHFLALLNDAVADRLRTHHVSLWLSGGLDSTMLAAVAAQQLANSSPDFGVLGLTQVFDELVAHDERIYAESAAEYIGTDIECFPYDDAFTNWEWLRTTVTPEPSTHFGGGMFRPAYARASHDARVLYTGLDGDALLAASIPVLWKKRLQRLQVGSLFKEFGWHLTQGRLPRVGFRSTLNKWRGQLRGEDFEASYPPWINADFERRVGVRERWRAGYAVSKVTTPRGGAYARLSTPVWRSALDEMDTATTHALLDQRHPLIDLRLIRFALSLPPIPWCVDKHLFRVAMRGKLPADVLHRRKTPLLNDPARASAARSLNPLAAGMIPAAQLAEYVDVPKYRAACEAMRSDASTRANLAWASLWTLTLDGWLYGSLNKTPNA